MKKTTNCNITKTKEFDVYCGRGQGLKNDPNKCLPGENGWLGNPIIIGKICTICSKVHKNGGETLFCYEQYLKNKLESNEDFKIKFYELKGKTLGCFCKPNPCHTDVIIKYLEN